jgi:DNA replication and repair protein RecF
LLRQLLARRFRNLEALDWDVEPGCHLLLGGNGAGKTSVLEAAYAAATTRSFRTTQIGDCAQRRSADPETREAPETLPPDDGFFVAVETGGEPRTRLEVAWSPQRGLERRCNGERAPLVRHLGALSVLVWSAAEVEMLQGSPMSRRRFLDRGVVYRRPGALQELASYRSLLAQKRALLRTGGSRRELTAWNALLAPAAASIAAQRASFVEALRPAFAEAARGSRFGLAELEVEYQPSPAAASEGVDALHHALERSIASELQARRPLLGPHRDRVSLRWRGEEIAQRASAGERKAIGLLLLAAQAMVLEHERSGLVLLVDDADAELDRDTLRALWPVLSQHPQAVATSNRPEVWAGLDAGRRWRLESGRMDPCK